MRRWCIRLAVALVAVGGISVAGSVGAFAFLRTPGGNDFLARRAEDIAHDYVMYGGRLSIGHLRTDLFDEAELRDVRVYREDGRQVASIRRIDLVFDPMELFEQHLQVDDVDVHDVVLDVELDADGELDILQLIGFYEPAEPWSGIGDARVDMPDIDVRGVAVRVSNPDGPMGALNGVDADVAITGEDLRMEMQVAVGGQVAHPIPTAFQLDGLLGYDGNADAEVAVEIPGQRMLVKGGVELTDAMPVDLEVTLEKVGLAHLPLVGEQGVTGDFLGSLTAKGPLDAIVVEGDLMGTKETTGTIGYTATVDVSGSTPSFTATADLGGLQAKQLYPKVPEANINGHVEVSGSGTTWPDDVVLEGSYRNTAPLVAMGYVIDDVSGDFKVEKGRATVSNLSADAIAGVFTVDGGVDAVTGDVDATVHGPFSLRRLRRFGVPKEVEGSGYLHARVRGNLFDTEPETGSGTVRMGTVTYGEDLSVEGVKASFSFEGMQDLSEASAVVKVTGGPVKGYGAVVDGFVGNKIVARKSGKTLSARGGIDAVGVHYGTLFDADGAGVTFDGSLRGSAIAAEADVALLPLHLLDLKSTGGAATLKLTNEGADFTADLSKTGGELASVGGHLDLSDLSLVLDHLRAAPTDAVFHADGKQHLRFTPTGIADAHVAVISDVGRASFDGRVGIHGDVDGIARMVAFELETVAKTFPSLAAGVSGKVDVDARISGDAQNPLVQGHFAASRIGYGDVIDRVDVRGKFDNGDGQPGVRTDLVVATGNTDLATVKGRLPLVLDLANPHPDLDGAIDVDVAVLPGKLERFEKVVHGFELPVEGRTSAFFDVSGILRSPDFASSGIIEVDVPGLPGRPARFEFRADRMGYDTQFEVDMRQDMQLLGNVSGAASNRFDEVVAWMLDGQAKPDFKDVTLYADNLFVSGVLLAFPANTIAAAAHALSGVDVHVGGTFEGGFNVLGSPYEPMIDGNLKWHDGQIGEQAVADGAYVSLAQDGMGYALDLEAQFLGDDDGHYVDGSLAVQGSVPIYINLRDDWRNWSAGDLALEVSGNGVPLHVASAVPMLGVEEPHGLLKLEGSVGGQIFDPVFDVNASIEDGSFGFPLVGLDLDGLNLDFEAENRELNLRSLSVHTAPLTHNKRRRKREHHHASEIGVSAKAQLVEWFPEQIEGHVALDDAWVLSAQGVHAKVAGRVDLGGAWPAVTATTPEPIRVLQAEAALDLAALQQAGPLELEEGLTLHRGEEDSIVIEHDDDRPIYADFVADVQVDLGRNVSGEVSMGFLDDFGGFGNAVSTVTAQARVSSDDPIQVKLENGWPIVHGEVDIVSGRAGVLRSRFDLQSGSRIVFAGDDFMAPELDVRGTMDAGGAQVNMHITGEPLAADPKFTSPQYADETMIYTMLITGRPPDSLSGQEAGQAMDAVRDALVSSVLAKVHLGALHVDPDGTVTVGFPVNQRMYASATTHPGHDLSENQISGELEWRLGQRTVLDVGIGNRISWTDTWWEVRF